MDENTMVYSATARWRIENETTVRTTNCPNVAERYRVRGYLVTEIEGND